MITQEIKREILNLKPIDKIHIAELIFDSLDKPDSEVEKIWIDESEKRYKAYKKNQIKGICLSEIKGKYEK